MKNSVTTLKSTTVLELTEKSEEDMMKVKNLGKTLKLKKLAGIGLALKTLRRF